MRLTSTLLFALLAISPAGLIAQQEAFENYVVDLIVNPDGSLDVTETITVRAAGDQVKRGITRSFPLRSQVEDARARRQSYTDFSVRRDGREEPFHTEKSNGYLTLYAGERDVFLDPGTYTYEISYRSPDQIYFLEEIDEISWTAIGTENTLPVRRATVAVRPPEGITPTQWACYAGPSGSRAGDCAVDRNGRTVVFTTGELPPGHGLTVSVGWPAGIIEPPPPPGWAESNGSWLIGLIGFLGALFYAYTRWERYGQDPPSPPVRIRFDAPGGLSPASVGYIASGHHTHQLLVASLIDLATKGYLEITEKTKKSIFSSSEIFVLDPCGKVPSAGELPPEEQVLYDLLIRDGDPVELDGSYNSRLAKASTAHAKSLQSQHGTFLSEGNNGWKVLPLVGILTPALVGSVLLFQADTSGYALPILIFLVVGFLIGIPVFAWLIRKPTPEKLQLRAEINGLKQYFSLSKKAHDRMADAPEMTEAHYREMLPYALALGVDSNYTEALAGDLIASLTVQHLYYHVGFGQRFRNDFASTATHPSSSGASGGGGSVGSGGGGGGAGGW